MLSLSPICSTCIIPSPSSSFFLSLQPPRLHIHMARSIYKTLTLLSPSKTPLTLTLRRQSSIAEPTITTTTTTTTTTESAIAESVTVQKIEEAIHGMVVRRSAPEWLPFVPGSSYWVPPRKPGCYGIASLFDKLANDLTEEELMALTTSRGWPSSAFFLLNHNTDNGETSSVEDEEN